MDKNRRIEEKSTFHFPGNLGVLLDRAFDMFPGRPGIGVQGRLLTFEEYHDRVCRIVHGLKKIGLGPNRRVLLMAPSSLEYALISLAVFRIGAELVPVNPRIRQHELAHILSDTHLEYVICERTGMSTVSKAHALTRDLPQPCLITIDERAPSTLFLYDLDLSSQDTGCEQMGNRDTAMIVYTAAMDGYAMGAQLTHTSLFNDAIFFAEECFEGENSGCEVAASILPLFHTYGFTNGFLVPLAGGVTDLLLEPSLRARDMVDIMDAWQVTQIVSVPRIFSSILKPIGQKPELRCRLKNLISGGVKISIELLEAYMKEVQLPINEGYGLTESSPVVTWNRGRPAPRFGTVGYPLGCCQIKIVDDKGEELARGNKGEVLVKGSNLFSGYLNQPERTKDAFLKGWFKTGDLGLLDEDNYLTLTGLKKDMINVFGLKAYPKEVERIIAHHPDIRSVHVCKEHHHNLGEMVSCVVSLKPGRTMKRRDFHKWCRENISPYKIPRNVRING